jgi:hypothetical protein
MLYLTTTFNRFQFTEIHAEILNTISQYGFVHIFNTSDVDFETTPNITYKALLDLVSIQWIHIKEVRSRTTVDGKFNHQQHTAEKNPSIKQLPKITFSIILIILIIL